MTQPAHARGLTTHERWIRALDSAGVDREIILDAFQSVTLDEGTDIQAMMMELQETWRRGSD
jgi:hypothetical protein